MVIFGATLNEPKENAMTTSLRTPLSAIAHQLQDDYLPTVRKPLPRELKDLLAQLVALRLAGEGRPGGLSKLCSRPLRSRGSGHDRCGVDRTGERARNRRDPCRGLDFPAVQTGHRRPLFCDWSNSGGRDLVSLEERDLQSLSTRTALHARARAQMAEKHAQARLD